MNAIDCQFVTFLNRLARSSPTFDALVDVVAHNDVVRTGFFAALLYWYWFRDDEKSVDRREALVCGLMASFAGLAFARVLAITLPFRERPLRNPDLHFVLPYSSNSDALLGWSAFPSDHATLFFGLATTLFVVSRRAGMIAFLHAFIVAGFARVYLGFHYPSDILGGALIGAGAVWLAQRPPVKSVLARGSMHWLRAHPASFNTVYCLLVLSLSSTFAPHWAAIRFAASLTRDAVVGLEADGLLWTAWLLVFVLIGAFAGLIVRRVWLMKRPSP